MSACTFNLGACQVVPHRTGLRAKAPGARVDRLPRNETLPGNRQPRCTLFSINSEAAPGPERDKQEGLVPALERNIEALVQRRAREKASAGIEQKIADAITTFAGSMRFVYLHLLIVGFWIVANLHWIPGIAVWDETFVVLAMLASVEAIFLSTFVLISQNRMAAEADKRADLDLQVSLLTEHELTEMARSLARIAARVGVASHADKELEEVTSPVAPEAVLDKIQEAKE